MIAPEDAALIHDLLNGFLALGLLSGVAMLLWITGYGFYKLIRSIRNLSS